MSVTTEHDRTSPPSQARRPLVRRLDGDGAPAWQVGGKAASLDRLVAAGIPVPPSVAITVHAYRAATATPTLAPEIDRLIAIERRGGAAADPGTIDAAAIDAAFLRARLPDDVSAELLEAVRSVRRRSEAGAVVVRSSATVEDTGTASFAGQYRSVLDVRDDDAALRAIRLVWASLWHPAPRAYRHAHAIDPAGAEMAVLVMAQVDARRSGVVFTADPAGAVDTARVEVVPGFADALVGGRVTPAAYLVGADGGTPDQSAATIGADVLEAVALSRRVAAMCGEPQDVEWASNGRSVFIVQARPITVLGDAADPFDTILDPHTTYTTSGIEEALPGVLAPLTWSIVGHAQEEAFRELFTDAGATSAELGGPHQLLGRHRGRAVLDFDRLRSVAASIPGADVDELERQYLGVVRRPSRGRPSRSRPWLGRHGRRGDAGRARRRAAWDAAVVASAADSVLDADVDTRGLADHELRAYHARLVDLGRRAITDETIVAATAAAAHQRLEVLLTSWFEPADASGWARRVSAPIGRDAALNGVATTSPDLARRAGARAVFGGAAWDEVDGAQLAVIAAPCDPPASSRQDDVDELERALRARPGWRTTRVLTGQVVDVRIHLLRRTIADARLWLARRDHAKDAVLRLGGELRRVHRELGHRLVDRGTLIDAADVELLSVDELARAIEEGAGPTPAALSRRCRQLRGHRATAMPASFVGAARAVEPQVPAGDRLVGWPASGGRARGHSRVVHDPLRDELADGDVLVAAMTDASWLPLFLRAGAVIVERGGPLSHAAICARELGLPAVINVPGVVARLEQLDRVGDEVVVDGDAGVVTIVSGTDAGSHPGGDHGGDRDSAVGADRASSVDAALASLPPMRANPLTTTFDELDEPALHVFVPAIMSLGVLASIGSLVVDGVRSLARSHESHRRVAVLGRLTAAATVGGEDAALRDRAGLRSRRTYAVAALAALTLAAYVVVGQTANYLRSHGYLSNIAWLWLVALVVGAAFAWVAIACARVAVHYRRPPPLARAALAWTPLTRRGSPVSRDQSSSARNAAVTSCSGSNPNNPYSSSIEPDWPNSSTPTGTTR